MQHIHLGFFLSQDYSFWREEGKLLDVIGRDLVELARAGKLDPLVGRKSCRYYKILSRRRKIQ